MRIPMASVKASRRSQYTSGGSERARESADTQHQVGRLAACGSRKTRQKQSESGHSIECQPLGADERQSFAPIFTRSASESACIFRMRLPRCIFTVISLILSSPPICLFS
jgi:hypothetical protein